MLTGNALVGQSGGPTSVINSSVAGVIQSAKNVPQIENIFGMRYGIEGLMQDNVFDFGAESDEAIEGLRSTPSSACGSCRYKLKDEDLPLVLEKLKKFNIRYFFLIGGNDTMDTVHRVEAYAQSQDYDMIGVGIPKTVDNDLFGTDHTPGYASAAKYMALSVLQAGVLTRDMKKVDQFVVFQCIGREAGWLPAAASLAKECDADAPHITLFPERAFDKDKFIAKVKEVYDKHGFVSVVCGEGITHADGSPVSASETRDKFNNVEFGAMGGSAVAVVLHKMIADEYGFRGEFQVTESLPMCAADRGVAQDFEDAYQCGVKAVELAAAGTTGVMVSMTREKGSATSTFETAPLCDVAVKAKPMPDEFISEDGFSVTDAYIEYAKPLVGELPSYTKLAYNAVDM
ncbi:diphosphate--fructose-6-phosphate 1-phosphotransferase [Poriferisphaera sp. WC338]|uniref:diphosphate--fructose-6-phosphate 1-phosphotransferase n=1 Tax=Poriferisphaera sp. WC338 TaxID=3425129 RepID=UPI003D8155FB